ncbi:hypothetical protein QP460_008840 [Corynebacterium amycolatum]|uniref:Secreted protein n=1 Tax=Corynebacterium amycolatum TaxID=43765 RepID=A0AAW9SW94_CORAY|nr:hypothetical protein [Corynebacterium amycolatum]MDK7237509.1 hypothetical protein [Corynebacterium amycolatum]MDK7247587.1 hypothetical protein [Corynebacterium amycolatum]
MSAHEPIDPWNSNQSTSTVDTPKRTSGTKPGKNKSLTLLLIVGAVGVIVAGAAGFAMGGKNAESELASANEEIYSLQQQAEERESELQTKIDELEDKNSKTHRESLKSDQAAAAAYNYKKALDWLNVCDARDYMPAETGAKKTSWGSLGVGCSYEFENPDGEIIILVSGKTNEDETGEYKNGQQDGYLKSIQTGYLQLNVWVSDSGPWADAEEKATDIAEKVSNAAELNKKQDTAEQ